MNAVEMIGQQSSIVAAPPLRAQPPVSLCMIVKNEESCLPRALANWRQVADELVVVDTGSTDRTVEIAKAAGAKVLHYDWRQPGHKGEARNVGIDAAQGDWIVVLDADEVIRDAKGLRDLLTSSDLAQVTALDVNFENYIDGALAMRWVQPRVFRHGLYRYQHREHEVPVWCGKGEPYGSYADVTFEHRAPEGRAATKARPMFERLALDVKEHPDDPHPLYFLHREHLTNGQYQECIETGYRYADMVLRSGDIPCECYGNMAFAFYALGNIAESVRFLHKAAAEEPHRRVWWIRLAETYMTEGKWQLALAHLRLAAELWPTFEWMTEIEYCGPRLMELIDKCQAALAATHHTHEG